MDVRQLVSFIGEAERGANLAASWLLTYALHSTVWILFAWWLAGRRFARLTPSGQHVMWTTSLVAGILTTTIQQLGFFTPLGGRWQVLDGARRALASVQVTVNRTDVGSPVATIRARLLDATRPTIRPLGHLVLPLRPDGGEPNEMRIVWKDSVASWSRTAIPPAAGALIAGRTIAIDERSIARPPGEGRHPHHAVMQAAIFPAPVTLILVASWGLVVLVLFGWLALSRARLARILGDRRRAEDTLAGAALRELIRVAGVRKLVGLSTTTRLASPAAIPGGEICLPRRVLHELTPLEQESLLAHELAHVVRHDTSWLWMARVIECVFFFQPLNRLARRRMQLAAEFASDQWAARVTNQPLRLAKCLARVAGWVTERSTVLAPAMVESAGSPLVQRVRKLATPDAATAPSRRSAGPLALVGAALAIIVIAPSVSVGANRDVVRPFHRAARDADQFAIVLRDSTGSALRKNAVWTVRPAN